MLSNPNPFTTPAWDGWWNWFITLVLSALASGFKQDVGLSAATDEKLAGASLVGIDRLTLEHTDWQDPSGFYGNDGAVDIGGDSSCLVSYED
ncbi:MAG: hypothetical protein AAF996_19150 [Pseudomonadota bacterium]